MSREKVFITTVHEKNSLAGFKVRVSFTQGRVPSYDTALTTQFRKLRGRFTCAEPIAWKRQDVMDYHNKRSFADCIVALDEEEIRQDILDMADSDSEAESDDADLFDQFEGTAISSKIITTSDHEQGWRVFKLLVKVDNFVDMSLGTSPFSIWIKNFGPTTETHRYGWDVAKHVLIENDNSVFLDMDESMDRLDRAWLHRPTAENIMEFLLVIDHDEKVVRFGCNNALFGYSVPFEPYHWYRIRARYGKCCEALMLAEVVNNPPALQQICSQFLLTMYEEQSTEQFGPKGPDYFCTSLVDHFYFAHCSNNKAREMDTRLKARKSPVEAFTLTFEKSLTRA